MKKEDGQKKYSFHDFFDIEEIQKIQDLFSQATGVASIISHPDGVPITKPSGFSYYCQLIRDTQAGSKNCMHSDAMIGRPNQDGPIIKRCMSGGLWDAGASIMAGEIHIANWLVGQTVDQAASNEQLISYAKDVGVTESDANIEKYVNEISRMPLEQFEKISNYLFYNAKLLSSLALDNLIQKEK